MAKKKEIDKELEAIRHSAEHVLTQAMIKLYPGLKMAMGPAIESGFYFDFDYDKQINEKDFPKIEKEMQKIIKKDLPFKKEVLTVKEARKLFRGNPYKQEWLDEIEKKKEKAVIYRTGDEFVDLCSGPHVKSTGKIGTLKLLSIAGAYWRGDEKNKMLTRIYGTAFKTKKGLAKYLTNLEEAKKRDHRKIGKETELFLIDPMAGLGLVMWQPKGALLWKIIEDFWHKEHLKSGYELVRAPHIGNRKLWETSGHWDFYSDSMYPPLEVDKSLTEAKKGKKSKTKEEYLLKPMNCPFHVLIYNSKIRSYKELPIRWAECGTVYRYEKSGELSGLTRVRGFTIDDAHIICTKDQVKDELKKVIDFIIYIFKAFGFKKENIHVYLSLRGAKDKKNYIGDDQGWKFTQKVLEETIKEKGLDYEKEEGEAAFYGPKFDFKIKDSVGRLWQCSTLQFDFNLPERFKMTFINKNGKKEQPYMLHRALFGSFERFIGLLIEHYKGAFPLWLAPEQMWVIPVGKQHIKYAKDIIKELAENDFRCQLKEENESVSKKIRKGEIQKIPYLLVVGDEEKKEKSVRVREKGKDLGKIKLTRFIEKAKIKIDKKR
ncbi:MAG: threonine--tRNA ligase [Candidatus Nealsonbacteria bacterium]